MQAKEELLEQLGETYGYVSEFAEKKLTLLKLNAAEKSASAFSSLILFLVVLIFSLAVSLFALLALAFYLSVRLDNYALGFGLVSILLLVLLFLIVLLRKPLIVNPAVKSVIVGLFPPEDSPAKTQDNE